MEYGINPNLVWTWISQYQREQGGPRSPICHESRLTRLTLSYRWYRCEGAGFYAGCLVHSDAWTAVVQAGPLG
nr:hypothetical protein [Burkholderia singularis]